MHEIHDNLLWLGNAHDIREPRSLFEAEVRAVVDVAYEEPPARLPREFVYCRFPLVDGAGNDPVLLVLCLQTLVDLLDSGVRTIVACSAGMSRSPTVAAHSLAFLLSNSAEDVIQRIAQKRSLDLHPELWKDAGVAFRQLKRLDRESISRES